jgi:hypothetical protein
MAYFSDPADVPEVTPRKIGGWKYKYGRHASGDWIARRTWEGYRPPGLNLGSLPKKAMFNASWSPTANQFPWMNKRGITSDVQRQAAFHLGVGGVPSYSGRRKPSGSYFNPATGFGGGSMRRVPGRMRSSVGKRRRAGFPSTLRQLNYYAPRATNRVPSWMLPQNQFNT